MLSPQVSEFSWIFVSNKFLMLFFLSMILVAEMKMITEFKFMESLKMFHQSF